LEEKIPEEEGSTEFAEGAGDEMIRGFALIF
jgi:hypothetical protein